MGPVLILVPFYFYNKFYILILFILKGCDLSMASTQYIHFLADPKVLVDIENCIPAPYVNEIIKRLDSSFISSLRNSNIPMLGELADGTTIGRYLISHSFYKELLGPNISFMDSCLRSVLLDEALADISYLVLGKGCSYPGITKTDLSMLVRFYCNTGVDPENKPIINTNRSDLISSPNGIVMHYDEYNPNRVVQLISSIVIQTLATVNTKVSTEDYPSLMLQFYGEDSLNKKIYTAMMQVIKNFVDAHEDLKTTYDSIMNTDDLGDLHNDDDTVIKMLSVIEKPIMVFFATALSMSGANKAKINDFFGKMKLNMIYEMGNTIEKCKVIMHFSHTEFKDLKGEPIKFEFVFQLGDLMYFEHWTTVVQSSNKRRAFGNNIIETIKGLCQMYLITMIHQCGMANN